MSMYTDSVQEQFEIHNPEGAVVAQGLREALQLVEQQDGDYTVTGDETGFEVHSFINGLVATDVRELLELLCEWGYRVTWPEDDVAEADTGSIQQHLQALGIPTVDKTTDR